MVWARKGVGVRKSKEKKQLSTMASRGRKEAMASRGRKEAKKSGSDKKFAWEGKKRVDKQAEGASERTILIALASIVLLMAAAVGAAMAFAPDKHELPASTTAAACG